MEIMEKVAYWHQWSQIQGSIFQNQSSYKRKTLNIYCKNLKNNGRKETTKYKKGKIF